MVKSTTADPLAVDASQRSSIHQDAVADAQAAYDWYATQNPVAAEAFIAELDHAVDRIETFSSVGPPYVSGTRRYLMRRFPFTVIYRETTRVIEVIAVGHGRRKPGYWKQRIQN